MSLDDCYPGKFVTRVLGMFDVGNQYDTFKKIQIYVMVTILVLLLQLGYLIKPFAYGFFKLLSWVSYLAVPVLISYIFGLMGRQGHIAASDTVNFHYPPHTVQSLRYLTCVWATFLLFAYAGFDNLNAFNLEERYGRSKLLVQIGIQFGLLFLIIYQLPRKTNLVPLLFAFLVLAIKFAGRLVALAHSAGATPRIKNDVTRIIDYMNNQEDVDDDDATTAGFGYLVGPKYTKIEGVRIVQGITMEKIWGSQGRLMGSSPEHNMELKDTCLSFALFWLLLGKFLGYPLYDDNTKSSPSFRAKAWRLVRHGLLAEKGDHDRVFRVIEIELAFQRDYFHARYIFFYLNGFYWKLISIVALPAMFWWFIRKAVDYPELNNLPENFGVGGDDTYVGLANTTVITVVVALEVIQVVVFLISRWLKVTFLCFYVKKMDSKNTGRLSRFFLEVIGSILIGFSRSSNSSWWRKPWKRELDQFSLVQSRTTLSKPISYLTLQIISIVGLPFSKPGWKQGNPISLSEQVKEAVILCLRRNDACPKLTNGAQSLSQNGVMEMLPIWACNLKSDAEMIIIWHIATSICELHHDPIPQSSNHMKVATELSKYCAYLLFFAPSLLPVLPLVAEKICDAVIEETLIMFKKPSFGCGKGENADTYEKLMELISVVDEEAEDKEKGKSLLKKGVKLGKDLVTQMEGIGRVLGRNDTLFGPVEQ